jgi:hypothetical protein
VICERARRLEPSSLQPGHRDPGSRRVSSASKAASPPSPTPPMDPRRGGPHARGRHRQGEAAGVRPRSGRSSPAPPAEGVQHVDDVVAQRGHVERARSTSRVRHHAAGTTRRAIQLSSRLSM